MHENLAFIPKIGKFWPENHFSTKNLKTSIFSEFWGLPLPRYAIDGHWLIKMSTYSRS